MISETDIANSFNPFSDNTVKHFSEEIRYNIGNSIVIYLKQNMIYFKFQCVEAIGMLSIISNSTKKY